MFSSLPGEILLLAGAGLCGWLAGYLPTWSLHRRTYSLECAVADLETKVLTEIKRRAGQERQKSGRLEADIIDAAKNTSVEPELPWWAKIKQG